MSVKVSIITPVYKTEKFLQQCIESCLNQTLKNIEIVLVNDASPDGSDVIMREYASKYTDIVKCIFLEKNMRQGFARNIGIQEASGEYVTFVDSDDWIQPEMCETLYNCAISNDADLVQSDIFRELEIGCLRPSTILPKKYMEADKKTAVLGMLFEKSVGPCGKLLRRSFIIEKKLYFPTGMYAEDACVTKLWYLYAKKVIKVEQPFYVYFLNTESTGHFKAQNYLDDWFRAIRMLYCNLKEYDVQNNYIEEIEAITLYYTLGNFEFYLKRMGDRYSEEITQDLYKNIELIGNQENKYWNYLFTPSQIELLHSRDICKYVHLLSDNEKREKDFVDYYLKLKVDIDMIIGDVIAGDRKLAIWSKTPYAKGFHNVYMQLSVVDSLEEIEQQQIEILILLRAAHVANVNYILKKAQKKVILIDLETELFCK